jgi:hypothetical protein
MKVTIDPRAQHNTIEFTIALQGETIKGKIDTVMKLTAEEIARAASLRFGACDPTPTHELTFTIS